MSVRDDIQRVINANAEALSKPGVLTVRPGYQMAGCWITRKPAIVVTVEDKSDAIPPADRLPETLGGYAVDVRQASDLKKLQVRNPELYAQVAAAKCPEEQLAYFDDERAVSPAVLLPVAPVTEALAAAKPQLPYHGPDGFSLDPVEDDVTLLCHASPDAGWPTLREFLNGTKERLTLGLYDFTSAHVLSAVQAAMADKAFVLVLDHPAPNPTADQSDEDTVKALEATLGARFEIAWALEGHDPFAAAWVFENAYHIKVAVRDGTSFWLSSGNWNNSNQPDIDPTNNPADASLARKGDRDWHVIVEHAGLAATFEAYIKNDFALAAQHQATALASRRVDRRPRRSRPAASPSDRAGLRAVLPAKILLGTNEAPAAAHARPRRLQRSRP